MKIELNLEDYEKMFKTKRMNLYQPQEINEWKCQKCKTTSSSGIGFKIGIKDKCWCYKCQKYTKQKVIK
jgi:hypothetical protein